MASTSHCKGTHPALLAVSSFLHTHPFHYPISSASAHLIARFTLSKAEVPPTAQMHNPAKRWRKDVDGPSQCVVQLLLHGNCLWQRLRDRYALY